MLSTTTTACPSAIKRSTMWLPMKPAPPMTRDLCWDKESCVWLKANAVLGEQRFVIGTVIVLDPAGRLRRGLDANLFSAHDQLAENGLERRRQQRPEAAAAGQPRAQPVSGIEPLHLVLVLADIRRSRQARIALIDANESTEALQDGNGIGPEILEGINQDVPLAHQRRVAIDHGRIAEAVQERAADIAEMNVEIVVEIGIPVLPGAGNARHLAAMLGEVIALDQR